jgi:hypothetical protein
MARKHTMEVIIVRMLRCYNCGYERNITCAIDEKFFDRECPVCATYAAVNAGKTIPTKKENP